MSTTAAFERVIVGVDGREGGRDAIALARLLATPEARVVLAHVAGGDGRPAAEELALAAAAAGEPLAATSPTSTPAAEGIADTSLAATTPTASGEASALLERERAATEIAADIETVAASSVGRGLHQLAETTDADLLVVGSCHRGFIGRVLLGDDTRAALNGAPCAVAVAPLGYSHAISSRRTVGVGYDGSPESRAALATARSLASRLGARVIALRVVQIVGSPYAGLGGVAWGEALQSVLDNAKAEVAGLEGVEGEAVLGLDGEELAAFGERVDVLVVGSRSYGPLRRLMLGSTSQYLAGHARSPLLVLPRSAAGTAAAAGD